MLREIYYYMASSCTHIAGDEMHKYFFFETQKLIIYCSYRSTMLMMMMDFEGLRAKQHAVNAIS